VCRLKEACPSPPVPWQGHQSSGTKPSLSGRRSVSHHSAEVAIDGEGRQLVTWETLMDCLDNTGHSTLASGLRRELEP